MDQESYVRAARTIRDSNNARATISSRAGLLMALPFGGGRRILRYAAEMVRRTETQLRALEPPPGDALALEQHFLRPWSELADYLESLVASSRTRWVRPEARSSCSRKAPGPTGRHRLLHRLRPGRQRRTGAELVNFATAASPGQRQGLIRSGQREPGSPLLFTRNLSFLGEAIFRRNPLFRRNGQAELGFGRVGRTTAGRHEAGPQIGERRP